MKSLIRERSEHEKISTISMDCHFGGMSGRKTAAMEESKRQRLIRSAIEQLQCDLSLGALWLPVGSISLQPFTPESPTDQSNHSIVQSGKEPVMSGTQDQNNLEDKQNRLTQIAKAVAGCTQCPLHKTRLHPVPGEGHPNARIVFVGEAPGQSEDEQGRPFVGRAGQLLTKIIEAMGLKRQDVFICNILKSRPPKNRDPLGSEIAACIDYLYQQLEIIEPEIIVALGSHAAHTLLETTTPIGQLRGKLHSYQPVLLAEPIRLVATYHPAYLLRNYSPESRRRVWQDMQFVLKELNLPIPT